jgi:polysaccharide export outer membrane protein
MLRAMNWLSRVRLALGLAIALVAPGCATTYVGVDAGAHAASDFPNIGYAAWTEYEPRYRIYPGDQLDISVPSAPELSKTVTVQPDGRVSLLLIRQVMAADRTTEELQQALSQAYASQLVHPEIYVDVKSATPLKVFVGGEVEKPGVYDMPGDINALQAVILAGGFKRSAKSSDVVIIRRGPGGHPMMRTADLRRGVAAPGRSDLVPLRRFDVVYVPPSGLARAGAFMQQLRDLVPGNVGFDYAITNNTKIF